MITVLTEADWDTMKYDFQLIHTSYVVIVTCKDGTIKIVKNRFDWPVVTL